MPSSLGRSKSKSKRRRSEPGPRPEWTGGLVETVDHGIYPFTERDRQQAELLYADRAADRERQLERDREYQRHEQSAVGGFLSRLGFGNWGRQKPHEVDHSRDVPPIYFFHQNLPYYQFTNFAIYNVRYQDKIYPTAEHLFQAMKFMKDNKKVAEAIRNLPTAREAFDRGHANKLFVRKDWESVKVKKVCSFRSLS